MNHTNNSVSSNKNKWCIRLNTVLKEYNNSKIKSEPWRVYLSLNDIEYIIYNYLYIIIIIINYNIQLSFNIDYN